MENTIIVKVISNLTAAFRNIQLYAIDHPLVRKSISKTVEALDELFKEVNANYHLDKRNDEYNEFTFMVIENELVIKDLQYGKLPSTALNLAKTLKEKGIERLSLLQGLDTDELLTFASAFIKLQNVDKIKASEHIKIGKVSLKTSSSSDDELTGDAEVEVEEDFELIRRGDFERIQDIYNAAKGHKKLNIVGIESIVAQFMTTFKRELSPLLSMASLKSFDDYTYVHAANVCILTMAQAETLGLSGSVLHDIGVAAMVHDVGKTFIPDMILNKQGKLSKEEWEIMESHPAAGAKYLSNMPGIPNIAVLVAFEHHMKSDFSGYPKVSESYELHPCSQMTNIADVYDALSTIRPYRNPMEQEKRFNILREEAGTDFGLFLVENFIDMINASKKK